MYQINVVVPDTFNKLLMVVILFNVVIPDTFNELLIVVIIFNVMIPDTFNELLIHKTRLSGHEPNAHYFINCKCNQESHKPCSKEGATRSIFCKSTYKGR
jgi:hypothetical protein